jgi:NTP pyrophosphatase (non-canonical NTP hydrolase)
MIREKYQELAARTINERLYDYEMETHALHGMASEIGEISEIYRDYFDGCLFDNDAAKSELGDLIWFVAEYCTATNLRLIDFINKNSERLRTVMYDCDHEMIAFFELSMAVSKLQGLYQKSFQGHGLDEEKAKHMIDVIVGAILNYCSRTEYDLDEILQNNIDKLTKRYPYGFKSEHSLNRKEGDK